MTVHSYSIEKDVVATPAVVGTFALEACSEIYKKRLLLLNLERTFYEWRNRIASLDFLFCPKIAIVDGIKSAKQAAQIFF